MEAWLKAEVRQRAKLRCEYCHFPERLAELRFQIDQIIPQQHGGLTVAENLAWSCLRCNKHKGPNLSGIDPQTAQIVRLFHPRSDDWREHFAWRGAELVGLTATGRPTAAVLEFNHDDATLARDALMAEGVDFT